MEKTQVDQLAAGEEIGEAIQALDEEVSYNYDEYAMLTLARLYLKNGQKKEAGRLLRKMNRLFPVGDYTDETQALQEELDALLSAPLKVSPKEEGGIKAQKREPEEKAETVREEAEGKEQEAEGKRESRKEQTESPQIPQSIEECFEGTVGLDPVKKELDAFYSLLCLQNARKENNLQQNILKTTHFAVTGKRGCGKTVVGNIIARLLYSFGVRKSKVPTKIQGRDIILAYGSDRETGILNFFKDAEEETIIIENIEDIFKEYSDVPVRRITLCLEQIMHDLSESCSIIMTGTADALQMFIDADETFQDHLYAVIEMPQYSSGELVQITEKLAGQQGLILHEDAKKSLEHEIEREYKGEAFLNTITLNRYLETATANLAARYRESAGRKDRVVTTDDLITLRPEDFGLQELSEETLAGLLGELDSLVGLSSVKEQVRRQVDTMRVESLAREAGSGRKLRRGSMHMVFTGNPGTGKTTVAMLIGKIYHKLGILSKGHTVECTRQDLVGAYLGQTAIQTGSQVRAALGGVLFIDEAYSLCQDGSDSYGQEAVDTLVAELDKNRDNLLVIMAGYPKDMERLMETNPGLKSRFRNTITFEDYSVGEMVEIFRTMAKGENLALTKEADDSLYDFIQECSKTPDFGNARGVRNLFEGVKEEMNHRIVRDFGVHGKDGAYYETITAEDINGSYKKGRGGKKDLDALMEELNSMVGLASAKQKVAEIVSACKVREYQKAHGIEVKDSPETLHLLFKGNAGTGKTSVAKLLGQIYAEMGILKKNVFIEAKQADLVAEYIGQTAPKVRNIVEKADGGILFIDEAYSLTAGRNDFGQEAVSTLVAEMENRRDSLMVIVAGYPEEMDRFLASNQGLASRLSNEIYFEDYSLEDLVRIFKNMVQSDGFTLEKRTDTAIREQIRARRKATMDFGNARGVRNMEEQIIRKQKMRIAQEIASGKEPSATETMTLKKEDIIG